MDRLNLSLSLFFLALFFQVGNAQTLRSKQISLPEEVIKMTLSDDLVVSGSGLFFQILATTGPDQTLSEISKAAEIGLYNAAGEKVLVQKVTLKDGIGNGKIFIKPSLPSGEYSLIGATNWSMNNKVHPQFSKIEVIIINPFQNLDLHTSQDSIEINYSSPDPSLFSEKDNQAGIVLETDKKIYGLREKVRLNIQSNISLKKPFAISVNRVKPTEAVKPAADRKVVISTDEYFVPEVRGSIIQGTISSKDEKQSISNRLISLSIPGKKYIFKTGLTDAGGKFLFYLNENEYRYEDLNIYVVGESSDNFQVNLNKSVSDHISPEKKLLNLKIDKRLKDWIEFQSTANQIENAFFETKSDSLISPPLKDPFYFPLGFVYRLDEYTRFPTVTETFVEVISRAAVRKEGDRYFFKTFNYSEEEKIAGIDKLHPLILIDGIRIEDNSILVNYPAEKIEKITIVPDNYRYGSEIFAGIIDVTTNNGEYGKSSNLKDFNFLYPNLQVANYQPDYSLNNNLSRIPDYRTLLFWNSNIDLKEKTSLEKEFYTSDVEGWYKIDLKGYNDKGEKVNISRYFKVE